MGPDRAELNRTPGGLSGRRVVSGPPTLRGRRRT